MKLYQKFKTQWESDAPLLGKVEMRVPSSKTGYIIGTRGSKLQVNFYESEINWQNVFWNQMSFHSLTVEIILIKINLCRKSIETVVLLFDLMVIF